MFLKPKQTNVPTFWCFNNRPHSKGWVDEWIVHLYVRPAHTQRKFLIRTSCVKTRMFSLSISPRTLTVGGGKYHCMTDLLFDWFGIDQTSTTDTNSTWAKQMNSNKINRRKLYSDTHLYVSVLWSLGCLQSVWPDWAILEELGN